MKRFKNILCFVGTESNETAVNRAINLAIENDAAVTFMDVVKPLPVALGGITDVADPEELADLLAKDHRQKLLQRVAEYVDTDVPIDVVVAVGDPATQIVRQVLRDKHDLVIKSADGLSRAGRLFGSIARSLLRQCPCPVWILKPETHKTFARVLAAVDMASSDETHQHLNTNIIQLAHSIANREGAELHLVFASDLWMEKILRKRAGDTEIDRALDQVEEQSLRRLNSLIDSMGIERDDVRIHMRRGPAAEVIRNVADHIESDLLVMGTVCRTGISGLLIGNVAETVLADITCSVLALKPDGFETSVKLGGQAETSDNFFFSMS
ncbi:MAG: universal stress protein [Pirellulaceae bacterium]|nr:universal stress protein [Pirellulaceae bacterium]